MRVRRKLPYVLAAALLTLVILGVRTLDGPDGSHGPASSPLPVRPSLAGQAANGQSPAREVSQSFFSPALRRSMPYLAFLPPGYDSEAKRYPVLYMLHGLGGRNEEWREYGLFAKAEKMMLSGEIPPFIIVLPQGDLSYWVDHRDGMPWGRYTAVDVVAEIDRRYRTVPQQAARVIGGLSMGADGALQLALTFPGVFGAVGAHSPVLRPYDSAPSFYGDRAYFEERYPLTIYERRAQEAASLAIFLDIGDSDPWRENAEAFHEELLALGVGHTWRVWRGAHDPEYWAAHVTDYLRFYGTALTPP